MDGLKGSRTWKRYSKAVKLQAIQGYLPGEYSFKACWRKPGISDTKVLRLWEKRYTSSEPIKSTSKGTSPMTTGRKTTHKERIEIAQYCFEIDNYIMLYNEERYQETLNSLTPLEFRYQAGGENIFYY